MTTRCTLSPGCGCDYCRDRWGLVGDYKYHLTRLATKEIRDYQKTKSLYSKTPEQKRLDRAVAFLYKQLDLMTEKEDAHDEEDDDQGDDGEACECDCQACKSKPGRHDRGCPEHACEQVDAEDREMCYSIWSELEKLQDQLDLVQNAVDVAEGIEATEKALSSLSESTGGALVAPAVNRGQSSEMARRLRQLTDRRDSVQDRLRQLGVDAVRRSRKRAVRRPGRPRPFRRKR
jgi:hypothetical protein